MNLTLFRKGVVKSLQATQNHCKEVGWDSFRYSLKIKGLGLGNDGYIVPQEDLEPLVKEVVAMGGSCEQMAESIMNRTVVFMRLNRPSFVLREVTARISPNVKDPLAYMEAKWESE